MGQILQTLIETNMQSYSRKAQGLVLEGTDWGQRVGAHTDDLNRQLLALSQNCKDKMLVEVTNSSRKVHEKNIKGVISSEMNSLSETMARDLKEQYEAQVLVYGENMNELLEKGFGMEQAERLSFLQKQE